MSAVCPPSLPIDSRAGVGFPADWGGIEVDSLTSAEKVACELPGREEEYSGGRRKSRPSGSRTEDRMLKHVVVSACLLALLAGGAYADQARTRVNIPVARTSATSGKQMYTSYCAPCHGLDGRGQGPVSPALKSPVPDLSLLRRNNQGRFPDAHVYSVLQNGVEIAAHGTAEMPVWGPILGKMNHANSQERMLRVSNLSRFLDTLQVK